MTSIATGGIFGGGAAPSVAIHDFVPQLSLLLFPFPLAYRTARSNDTSPVPTAGAVQSAVHER